jgi:hypothetical protein
MDKEILKYKEGKIHIEYMNNLDSLNEYLDMTYYDPLRVTFIPDIVMTENQCLEFLNVIREDIIQNVENLTIKYNEFYQHFDIDYLNFYMSDQLEHEITKQKVTGKCVMILHCTPKEINLSKDNL